MDDELRELRLSKKLPAKDIVAVVQRLYPSFDKSALSKSEHGDKYGITLKRDALDMLIDEFAPEAKNAVKKRRDGGHRLTCRISCRLEENDYSALQQAIKANGCKTTQEWLTETVKKYIDPKMKGATEND